MSYPGKMTRFHIGYTDIEGTAMELSLNCLAHSQRPCAPTDSTESPAGPDVHWSGESWFIYLSAQRLACRTCCAKLCSGASRVSYKTYRLTPGWGWCGEACKLPNGARRLSGDVAILFSIQLDLSFALCDAPKSRRAAQLEGT